MIRLDINGSLAINIGKKQTATLHIKDKQITLNIKNITKTAKIIKTLIKKPKQQPKQQEDQETKEIPIKLLKQLNKKGYKIKIKIKGITIIRDLKPSNLELINKLI